MISPRGVLDEAADVKMKFSPRYDDDGVLGLVGLGWWRVGRGMGNESSPFGETPEGHRNARGRERQSESKTAS